LRLVTARAVAPAACGTLPPMVMQKPHQASVESVSLREQLRERRGVAAYVVPSQQYVQSFCFGSPIAATRSGNAWYRRVVNRSR
jgi:hypothetical protein